MYMLYNPYICDIALVALHNEYINFYDEGIYSAYRTKYIRVEKAVGKS